MCMDTYINIYNIYIGQNRQKVQRKAVHLILYIYTHTDQNRQKDSYIIYIFCVYILAK